MWNTHLLVFSTLVASLTILSGCFRRLLQDLHHHRARTRRAVAEVIAATDWDTRHRAVRQIPKYYAMAPKGIRCASADDMKGAK